MYVTQNQVRTVQYLQMKYVLFVREGGLNKQTSQDDRKIAEMNA